MAPERPAHGQPASSRRPVPLDRLMGEGAAARRVTAIAADERSEGHAIDVNQEQEGPGGHGGTLLAWRDAGGAPDTHARPPLVSASGSRPSGSTPGRIPWSSF